MIIRLLLLLALTGQLASPASRPSPSSVACALLDRLLAAAEPLSSSDGEALALLEKVAVGRTPGMSPAMGSVLESLHISQEALSNADVRACAFTKLGQSGLLAATEFLETVRESDLSSDGGQTVWRAAQIAIREAHLRMIPDSLLKEQFLEGVLSEQYDAASDMTVKWWAINELCNRGAIGSRAAIERTIRTNYPGHHGEEEIEFCEARMQVLGRTPDRIKALGTSLNLLPSTQELRVKLWAIDELRNMHLAAADAELERFAGEIGKLPPGSSDRLHLAPLEEAIRDTQNIRRRP